jgi:hypothetical protein
MRLGGDREGTLTANQDARLARELTDRVQRCEELQGALDLLSSEERTEFDDSSEHPGCFYVGGPIGIPS